MNFQSISDLSELYNSNLAGPFALIAFGVFIDLLLMVFYVGESKNNRRRGYKPQKRHHHHYRGRHYRTGPYGNIGRMGDVPDYENESQRLD